MAEERLVYSVTEAAQLLDISRGSAYSLVKQGLLPAIRVGRRRYVIPKIKLMAMLEGNGDTTSTWIASGHYIPPGLRWAVWERDNFTCKHCGSRTILEVDHVIPVSKGGITTLSNLQTLCSACNRGKHNK